MLSVTNKQIMLSVIALNVVMPSVAALSRQYDTLSEKRFHKVSGDIKMAK